jgi:carbonic anhydrase
MGKGKFVTAINCMDGRVQEPMVAFMKDRYGADYVDMITEPGPIKALSENKDQATLESVKRRVGISVNGHGSGVIAIAGHYDCAGNPVEKDVQLKQIDESVKTVTSWGFNAETIKLWINENWEVNVLK